MRRWLWLRLWLISILYRMWSWEIGIISIWRREKLLSIDWRVSCWMLVMKIRSTLICSLRPIWVCLLRIVRWRRGVSLNCKRLVTRKVIFTLAANPWEKSRGRSHNFFLLLRWLARRSEITSIFIYRSMLKQARLLRLWLIIRMC